MQTDVCELLKITCPTRLRNLQNISKRRRKAGMIQIFEVAFELSWKVMKDYLLAEGYDVKSPRESIKTAFDYGLIADGAKWLEALEKRNLAAYTYDESILDELQSLITRDYHPLMQSLKSALEQKLCIARRVCQFTTDRRGNAFRLSHKRLQSYIL